MQWFANLVTSTTQINMIEFKKNMGRMRAIQVKDRSEDVVVNCVINEKLFTAKSYSCVSCERGASHLETT